MVLFDMTIDPDPTLNDLSNVMAKVLAKVFNDPDLQSLEKIAERWGSRQLDELNDVPYVHIYKTLSQKNGLTPDGRPIIKMYVPVEGQHDLEFSDNHKDFDQYTASFVRGYILSLANHVKEYFHVENTATYKDADIFFVLDPQSKEKKALAWAQLPSTSYWSNGARSQNNEEIKFWSCIGLSPELLNSYKFKSNKDTILHEFLHTLGINHHNTGYINHLTSQDRSVIAHFEKKLGALSTMSSTQYFNPLAFGRKHQVENLFKDIRNNELKIFDEIEMAFGWYCNKHQKFFDPNSFPMRF